MNYPFLDQLDFFAARALGEIVLNDELESKGGEALQHACWLGDTIGKTFKDGEFKEFDYGDIQHTAEFVVKECTPPEGEIEPAYQNMSKLESAIERLVFLTFKKMLLSDS